jgi:hypothetical protein
MGLFSKATRPLITVTDQRESRPADDDDGPGTVVHAPKDRSEVFRIQDAHLLYELPDD